MISRIRTIALATVGGVLLAAAVLGSYCAYADPSTDSVKTAVQNRLGSEASVKGVAKTPIAGLYEVNLGKGIIYSDANADYLVLGDLVDIRTRKNLTEARNEELNTVDFSSLPLANAVKVVKGNGARKLAVFSDPNCGYCKRLETSLKGFDNITIYTFLYPVLSPDSEVKAKSIWCSSDRAKAWQAWMLDHQSPSASGNCDTSALQKNLALGQKLDVTGAPTIILADGRRLRGAVPAEQLDKALSAQH
ncbi:hypothetical protein DFQ28_005544 [Apophysomyces sp. BC1034]|nr:hypothetical protein DFQ28_005544 [Apophysomyces sp. BC1034]